MTCLLPSGPQALGMSSKRALKLNRPVRYRYASQQTSQVQLGLTVAVLPEQLETQPS